MIKRMFHSIMDKFIEKLFIGFVTTFLLLSLLLVPEIRYFIVSLVVMFIIGHIIYSIYQYLKMTR